MKLILIVLLISLPGCATAGDSTARLLKHVPGYLEACKTPEEIDTEPCSAENMAMVSGLLLEALVRKTKTVTRRSISAPSSRATYESHRDTDLIIQHGAGGCTPNFVTGGCL